MVDTNDKLSLDLNGEGYVDRMEVKIESPNAESICAHNSFSVNCLNSEGSSVDGPLENDTINNNIIQENENVDNDLKDECWIDRTEEKISPSDQSKCLKQNVDKSVHEINGIHIENESKKPQKVSNYEITSATSFFLFNTKNTKESSKIEVNGSPIKVKEKEVSMLYQMGVEAIGKPVESKKHEEYPLQLADTIDSPAQNASMASQDSRAAAARTGWATIRQESGDIENYLLEEDDDENVIIHLGTEFSQDTMNDGKAELAMTVDVDHYGGTDQTEVSKLNVMFPSDRKIDKNNLAEAEDTSLSDIEEKRHELASDKLSQLENVLSNIKEDSLHTVERGNISEHTGRPSYTTQVSAESKDGSTQNYNAPNSAQEDRTGGKEIQSLELKSVTEGSVQGLNKDVQMKIKHEPSSQEQLMKETVHEQLTEKINTPQTYSMNEQGLSQQLINSQKINIDNTVPPVRLIEVERKFRISNYCRLRLTEMGAVLAKEKKFTDEYFDDLRYKVTLSDSWLRRRNESWEFKIPPKHIGKKDTSSQYAEITSESEIIMHLSKIYNYGKSLNGVSLDSLINELHLDVFATFSTTRQTYHLPNCTVDLDMADFGFEVGEIEVMVSDETRIPEALNIIDDMAKKLDMQPFKLI